MIDYHELLNRYEELQRLSTKAVEAIDRLVSQSEGVYGLHKNDDGAPWDDLFQGGHFESWLKDVDALRVRLQETALKPTEMSDVDRKSNDARIVTWLRKRADEWQTREGPHDEPKNECNCSFECGESISYRVIADAIEADEHADTKPKIWDNDLIQFARLLAEINANVAFPSTDLKALCESMDLPVDRVNELFDRADKVWEESKKRLRSE